MDSGEEFEVRFVKDSLTGVIVGLSLLLGVVIGILFKGILTDYNRSQNITPSDDEQSSLPYLLAPRIKYREGQVSELNANVYFTLGSVIQSFTIAVIGFSLVNIWQSSDSPHWPLVLLTAFNSLFFSVLFWFAFLMAYFYLFRIVNLRAKDHLLLSFTYFSIGFAQVVAFLNLANIRTWISIILAILIVASIEQGYMRGILRHQQSQSNKIQIMLYAEYRKLSTTINWATFILIVMVVLWYIIPTLNSDGYALVVLLSFALVLLIIASSAIKTFQFRLDNLYLSFEPSTQQEQTLQP